MPAECARRSAPRWISTPPPERCPFCPPRRPELVTAREPRAPPVARTGRVESNVTLYSGATNPRREPMSELKPRTLISVHKHLRDQVANALRAALIAGDLKPGIIYSAPTLAAEYGVSATPVREAMLDLAREGDRKSKRLNSSHGIISYAVFFLKINNRPS